MSRATVVYLVMATLAIAGLWVILEIGGRLVPPRDFAGSWSLSSSQPGGSDVGNSMKVEQSGRFLQLQFASGLLLKLRMTDTQAGSLPRPAVVPLAGSGVTATLNPQDPTDDAAVLTLSGTTSGTWTARRQTRTFAGENAPAPPGTAHAQRSGD